MIGTIRNNLIKKLQTEDNGFFQLLNNSLLPGGNSLLEYYFTRRISETEASYEHLTINNKSVTTAILRAFRPGNDLTEEML